MIRDTIETEIRTYRNTRFEDPTILVLDTYSLAMLREELGYSEEKDLSEFKGLRILVEDEEEMIRVIGEDDVIW